jgi:hypothetical protein
MIVRLSCGPEVPLAHGEPDRVLFVINCGSGLRLAMIAMVQSAITSGRILSNASPPLLTCKLSQEWPIAGVRQFEMECQVWNV